MTYMTARVAVGLAGPPELVEKLSLAHSMHGSALSCPMLYTSASLDIKANLHLIGLLAQNAVDHNEPGKDFKGHRSLLRRLFPKQLFLVLFLGARAHRLSRLACRRAPVARVLARRFAKAGERSARSPVGSAVTAGPLGPAAGVAPRAPGAWPCLAALAAAIRSARSCAADCRASTATRRLTRAKLSSNASAFMDARVFSGRALPRPPCSPPRHSRPGGIGRRTCSSPA